MVADDQRSQVIKELLNSVKQCIDDVDKAPSGTNASIP